LFNRESPLLGREFSTRKITDSVAEIKWGQLEWTKLSNLDARRDGSLAEELLGGVWSLHLLDEPESFVLAFNPA
jgi:GDPmannose 4,6-dehydratase